VDLNKLDLLIARECALDRTTLLACGVSGGPDSLCMLHILRSLGCRVLAVHYDHHLRPESGEEAECVRAAAAEMGVPFILGGGDVLALAATEKMSVEEAARTARYRFIFRAAREAGAAAVAVAHTADDQVETLLMHLLRGAGLSGLKGMPYRAILPEWDASIPLLRPLLETWRAEVLAYCAEHNLRPSFDQTNEDTTYYRNRLRHDLLPYLQQYNPRVKQALWRTASTLAGDHALLEEALAQAWESCNAGLEGTTVRIGRAGFLKLGRGAQRGVMRRAVGMLRPALRDIDFDTLERAVNFILAPPRTGKMDLAAGLCLTLEGGSVLLHAGEDPGGGGYPQLPGEMEYPLPVPGRLELGEGWSLEARFVEGPGLTPGADPAEGWLDAASIPGGLVVRRRRDSDRFAPLGLGGRSQKLSDFFINQHLPRRARVAYPLVCAGETIAWVPGFRPAEFCAVQPGTTRAVVLRLVCESPSGGQGGHAGSGS
jgi:tRNA(Ile)-lysidine synthase